MMLLHAHISAEFGGIRDLSRHLSLNFSSCGPMLRALEALCINCNTINEGPFINDVRREGEGGGWPISDDRNGGCVDLVLTEGVSKSQKI